MHFPKMPVPSPDVWKAGLRTAVAGGLAYGVAELFALPQGFWAVVTAVVLMGQPRVGASLKAGADRFVGTIVGALAGFLVATITPSTVLGTASGLLLSIGVLGMLAARDSSFRVAPMTAAIVLISPASHAVAWVSALHRVIEILIGCIIGILVSLFVAPARSDTAMRDEANHALTLLAKLISLSVDRQEGKPVDSEISKANKDIDGSYRKIGTLTKEVAEEEATHIARSTLDPASLRHTLIDLRSAVFVLRSVSRKPWPAALGDAMIAPTRMVTAEICDYMLALGAAITSVQSTPSKELMNTAFVAYSSAAAAALDAWRTGASLQPSGKAGKSALADPPALGKSGPDYISNVSFALEQIRYALDELADCVDGRCDEATST